MKFTQANFRQFDADLKAAVKDLETKYNVTITPKGGSYTDSTFTTKLTMTKVRQDGLTPEQVDWNNFYSMYNFKKDDLGRVFSYKGVQYKIAGVNAGAKKYIIATIKLNDNSKISFTVNCIREIFGVDAFGKSTATTPGTLSLSLPPNFKGGRKDQVAYFLASGITSPTEIATKLGTNAGYVSRLINELKS